MAPGTSNSTKADKNSAVIPLTHLKPGKKGKIAAVRGGRMVIQRLNDLGLTIGTELTIKGEAPWGGPVQILVRGSILALGRGIAAKIMVKQIS
ncbi:MAG: ferrous iron transport protein A [Candidatus Hermodarchaeota archaeon]